jgi:hypothetical protein
MNKKDYQESVENLLDTIFTVDVRKKYNAEKKTEINQR